MTQGLKVTFPELAGRFFTTEPEGAMEGIELWTQFSFCPLMNPGTLQCVFEGDWREDTEKGEK